MLNYQRVPPQGSWRTGQIEIKQPSYLFFENWRSPAISWNSAWVAETIWRWVKPIATLVNTKIAGMLGAADEVAKYKHGDFLHKLGLPLYMVLYPLIAGTAPPSTCKIRGVGCSAFRPKPCRPGTVCYPWGYPRWGQCLVEWNLGYRIDESTLEDLSWFTCKLWR